MERSSSHLVASFNRHSGRFTRIPRMSRTLGIRYAPTYQHRSSSTMRCCPILESRSKKCALPSCRCSLSSSCPGSVCGPRRGCGEPGTEGEGRTSRIVALERVVIVARLALGFRFRRAGRHRAERGLSADSARSGGTLLLSRPSIEKQVATRFRAPSVARELLWRRRARPTRRARPSARH